MAAKQPNQMVYRYNGVAESDEVESDVLGEIRIPEKDEVLDRRGKSWRVVQIQVTVSFGRELPIYRVFLQELPGRAPTRPTP